MTIDNFKVRNLAAMSVVDGRFESETGNVRVTGGRLQFYNSDGTTRRAVDTHVSQSKGIVQADIVWEDDIDAGLILHYQDPENFLVAQVHDGGLLGDTARLVKFVDGKKAAVVVASAGSFTLLDGFTYTLKAVIEDDADPNYQELQFYVGGTLRLTTTAVDDEFQGGHVGVWRETDSAKTNTVEWDSFMVGQDKDTDGTIGTVGSPDAGDDIYAAYDFNDTGGGSVPWQKMTLTHDANGNLTSDGLFKFTYDAWNRLVGAWYAGGDIGDPNERVATYEYDGENRRVSKIVTNKGSYIVHNSDDGGAEGTQAGNRTEEHFWTEKWQLAENRNGSGDTLAQWAYGTQYVDEPVAYDRNTDSSDDGDCLETNGAARYTYHQDDNYRVVALTHGLGELVERCIYSAYGSRTVMRGNANSSEISSTSLDSTVGNPHMQQGLLDDFECRLLNHRRRQASSITGQFLQVDPAGYVDGIHLRQYLRGRPTMSLDPGGLNASDSYWQCICDPANQACAANEGMSLSDWCTNRDIFQNQLDDATGFDSGCAYLHGYLIMKELNARQAAGERLTDKWMHCYAGCHVACNCGVPAGCLAGAIDELKDLTDCKPTTTFDLADDVATCLGVQMSDEANCNCDAACSAKYQKHY